MDLVPSSKSADSETENTASGQEQNPQESSLEALKRTLIAPRLYRGKINHVHSVCVADITIRVEEFGSLSFSYRCFLNGVPDIHNSDEKFTAAKRCTVMLLGGRDVVIETVKTAHDRSNMATVVVYRKGAVPCTDCNITIDAVDYLNVNRYLDWLSRQETPFNHEVVAQHRRGLA